MAEAARQVARDRVARDDARTVPAGAALARFALHAEIPDDALDRARSALLDTLAVTVAGGREPGVARLAAALPGSDTGVPSLWSPTRYRDEDAALLLGTASHVLDYDDVAMVSVCHPTAPVLAALLAGAEQGGTAGRALLEALVVGTEVSIRVGEAMGFRHYALGFHATSTLGTLGATAALARLRGFDAARTTHALAIAASMACGVRVNFGSDVKSLHVGLAAANAVRAVRLAGAGLVGAAEPLEGVSGFLHAFSGGQTAAWPDAVRLGQPFAIVEPGFEQKRYPCCYLVHKMIEGTLALRREAGLDLGAVASARIVVPQGGASALIHPFPRNGLNALFSAPYAVCASLADGRIDLASFTDAAVLRPQIQRRLQDIAVVERVGAREDVGTAPVEVTLVPREGAPVSTIVRASPGSPSDPITPEQAQAKWADCLARGARHPLPPALSDDLLREGRGIAEMRAVGGWLGRLAAAVSE